jgi:hypothetical protein
VGEDVMGMHDKRGVGEIETFKVSSKGLKVEVEPRVTTKAIEVDRVQGDEGELIQSGSVEMRREVAVVNGRLLW